MATVLTEPKVEEGTVHVSFPILKWEQDEDGDLVVKGVATDGTLDSDEQVVSPEWSAKALDAWISTGGNVRMSHDPRRPVGKGLQVEVNKDGSGKHWVTSVIVDKDAQKLIKKGVLTAYSVGIARPVIKHDPTGKARGGIIVGGELCELSVVDRPSNKNSYLEIAKAAADGTCEFTGKVFGADADDDLVSVDLPKNASISISPADFAKLNTFKQQLVTKAAVATEADTEKRDVNTAERRSLAGENRALPDGSYPIKSHQDAANAVTLALSGHGDAGAAKSLIRRVAREEGWQDILDRLDGKGGDAEKVADVAADEPKETVDKAEAPESQDAAVPEVAKEAEPDLAKDPEENPKPKPVKKAKRKKKKLPPWLNKPDDDGDADDASKSCKNAHTWALTGSGDVPDIVCEKCHTTPAEAAGLSGTHDMTCAPVPELLESPPMASTKGGPTPESASGAGEAAPMDPTPAGELLDTPPPASAKGEGNTVPPTALEAGMMKSSPEVAAILRFKAAGIDIELGRLHDLTCPAYHPEDTAKCHPFADLRYTDEGYFQRKSVEAACGPDMDAQKSLNLAWQAAHVLKAADPAELNQYRLDAHKAFRDANPGPNSAPTPGMMTPGRYNRPLITDGHEASSPAHDGPNSSPQVATSAPNAHSFDRPPLASGHQSPSPSHMKADFEYPSQTGTPTQLNYAVMEKEKARQALAQMHEHLSRQFPQACPIDMDRPAVQPESRGVPPTAGIGKGAAPDPVPAPPAAASFKADPEDLGTFADAEVYKSFKKMKRKLGKKVIAGKLTVDEARTMIGRKFTQKGAEEPQEAVQKSALKPYDLPAFTPPLPAPLSTALPPAVQKAAPPAPVAAPFGPEDIEAAVTKAVAPLLEKIREQDETYTTKLAETQRVIDAIADQPDPSTAAFSGLAFNPLRTNKAARPAGVATTAEIAERTQQMMIRHLNDTYNSASDPYEREAARATLVRLRGGDA